MRSGSPTLPQRTHRSSPPRRRSACLNPIAGLDLGGAVAVAVAPGGLGVRAYLMSLPPQVVGDAFFHARQVPDDLAGEPESARRVLAKADFDGDVGGVV